MVNPLILSKMTFCEKVRLLGSQWVGLYQEILLNLSTLGNGRILGDSEFNIFIDENPDIMVEICLEDFRGVSSSHKNSLHAG